jgi:glucokinase
MDGATSTTDAMGTHHLGIDLGGTNLKWTVVEQRRGAWAVVDRGQVPTPATAGPDGVMARICELALEARTRWPSIATIGIGVPGLYDPATGAARFLVNLPGEWAGRPIAAEVTAAVERPVRLINDARAFGLAELRLGAGRGARAMVGLTLGTGVGGVIAIDGRIHLGHDGTGGELGHQTIDPDGPRCGCGNHGCLEAFVRADRFAEACGTATVEAAVVAARAGDSIATAGIERMGRYLGIGIANMVTVVTPDRVVVGGGIAAAADLLFEPIRDELRRRVHTTQLDDVELVVAELGPWAGAIGASVHGSGADDDAASGAAA